MSDRVSLTVIFTRQDPDQSVPLYAATPPDWVIEILSPDQRATRVITKIQACLEAETRLAWLIDPLEEVVMVFWRDRPLVILRGNDLLPVLPDMQLELTPIEIFAWMKSQ